ncbi:hypothetical protein SK128_021120 [Halocaridina rubra]|uniref:Nucleosome-remodeling factor subunit BPTF n=1 Tax=Halocaridina rubra TaxID=373956 RepID=A0AAN8XAU0_HALRR
MSEKKRKRGRPRSTPILSYSSEMKKRNSITRVIKKPRYLQDPEEESNHSSSRAHSPSSRTSQYLSLGNGGKSKSRRGYNPDFDDKDSEYLYGSDFELDAMSDKEDFESGSVSDDEFADLEEHETGFSDGETSLSSFSTNSESKCITSRPQTPVPVWLQDRDYPPLELPKSSDDLLLPCAYVLKAVGIYEVLRHFRTLVRLSPMRFEDFTAALLVEEQNSLLAEIHMSLLKALIREEDSQQTHFGPLDQKDSINVILYFIDSLSWAESLRLYLQSDREFAPTLKILDSCTYPYTTLENRLQVLQFLCDQFLQTSVVREDLLSEGKLRYDDHCRVCHKTGDLLCCDSCSAVYHLDCVDPPLQDIPGEMEDWTCSVCTAHTVEGVTDCISPMETSGILCRQDPLGYDRHGRKYWFLVRRLFVESEEGEIWYYTTRAQLSEIISLLDAQDLEEELCGALSEIFSEMKRHMAVTESLTQELKGTRKSCLEIEDDLVEKRAQERKANQIKKEQENADKLIEEVTVKEEKVEIKEDKEDSTGEGEEHVSKLDPVTGDLIEDSSKPGVKNSTNNNNTAKEKVDLKRSSSLEDNKENVKKEKEVATLPTETQLKIKMGQLTNSTKWYRLGCDGKYKTYVNQYSSNSLALNKLQHNEERDKRDICHTSSASRQHRSLSGTECCMVSYLCVQ